MYAHNAYDESRQQMYAFRFQYVWNELNLEGQFANVNHYQYYTKLNIQAKSFSVSGERLEVHCWNNGDWVFLGNLNADKLNTFTVTLTDSNFHIKFKDSNNTVATPARASGKSTTAHWLRRAAFLSFFSFFFYCFDAR